MALPSASPRTQVVDDGGGPKELRRATTKFDVACRRDGASQPPRASMVERRSPRETSPLPRAVPRATSQSSGGPQSPSRSLCPRSSMGAPMLCESMLLLLPLSAPMPMRMCTMSAPAALSLRPTGLSAPKLARRSGVEPWFWTPRLAIERRTRHGSLSRVGRTALVPGTADGARRRNPPGPHCAPHHDRHLPRAARHKWSDANWFQSAPKQSANCVSGNPTITHRVASRTRLRSVRAQLLEGQPPASIPPTEDEVSLHGVGRTPVPSTRHAETNLVMAFLGPLDPELAAIPKVRPNGDHEDLGQIPWRHRGPADSKRGETWRGQKWREGSGRWANREGAKK